jgi:hypothetical protein
MYALIVITFISSGFQMEMSLKIDDIEEENNDELTTHRALANKKEPDLLTRKNGFLTCMPCLSYLYYGKLELYAI